MFDRIIELLRKEFIQLFRDKRMRMIVFVMPIIQLLIFGYVLILDINNVNFGVLDMDKTYESRNVINAFEASPYFTLNLYAKNEKELENGILSGNISLGIKINSGFQSELKKSKTTCIQTFVDGSISNLAAVSIAYTNQVIQNYNMRIMKDRYYRSIGLISEELRSRFPKLGVSGLDVRIRSIYNPDMESRNFYLPCVIALLITVLTLLLTSMAIVREKEIGTMEQLIVTPIKTYELIIGKTIPFVLIGIFDTILTTVFGLLWFKVPLYGSIIVLSAGVIVYLLCTLSLGLLISIISKTQQQAMMTSFLILYPLMLLSGFMFPIENMPIFFQYITYLNPLRYFIIIIRGVFLKGSGFSILWTEFTCLFLLGMALFVLSVTKFTKKLG